ncbi:hypothetical protein [Massilia sp. Root335]|jgi:hypothetical protein|uniref:hypothetical protein n=1 Tax=Massilia sp. Root335 TaxID=1736517 RepID=UPI000A553AA5|nr:hypothetical protein [Massilia sp. Root335]
MDEQTKTPDFRGFCFGANANSHELLPIVRNAGRQQAWFHTLHRPSMPGERGKTLSLSLGNYLGCMFYHGLRLLFDLLIIIGQFELMADTS